MKATNRRGARWNVSRLRAAILLVAAVTVAVSTGCSAAPEADSEGGASALDLAHAEVDVEVLSGFPSLHRDQDNFLGERDEEIAEWSLHYVVTPDGFDGVVAFGRESNGTVRYLTALDSKSRLTMVLDGVAVARNAEASVVERERTDAELEFVAQTFDEVTVQWLRSELYRMIADLEGTLQERGGIGTRALSRRRRAARFAWPSIPRRSSCRSRRCRSSGEVRRSPASSSAPSSWMPLEALRSGR